MTSDHLGDLAGTDGIEEDIAGLFLKHKPSNDSNSVDTDLDAITALFQDFENVRQAKIFAHEYDLYQSFLDRLKEEAKSSNIVDLGNDPSSTAVSSSANLEVLMKNLYDSNSALSEPAKEVFTKAYHAIAEENDLEHKELVIPTSITQDNMADTLSNYLRISSEVKLALMYLLSPTHDDDISKYIASRFKDRRKIAELTIQIDTIDNQLKKKATSIRKDLVPKTEYDEVNKARAEAEVEMQKVKDELTQLKAEYATHVPRTEYNKEKAAREKAEQSFSNLEKTINDRLLTAMKAGEEQTKKRFKDYVPQADLDAANKATREAQTDASEAQKNAQDLQSRLTEANNNYVKLEKDKAEAEKERDEAKAAQLKATSDEELARHPLYQVMVEKAANAEARAKAAADRVSALEATVIEVKPTIPPSLDITARSPKRTTEATVNDRYLTLFREVGDTSDALDSALTMFYSGDKAVEAKYDGVLSQLNTLSTKLESGLETYLVGDTENTAYAKDLANNKADNLRTADYVVAQNKAIALAQKARITKNKDQLAEAHTVLTQAKLILEAIENTSFRDQYSKDYKQTESFISNISIN